MERLRPSKPPGDAVQGHYVSPASYMDDTSEEFQSRVQYHL
jgi:hypothetical protein